MVKVHPQRIEGHWVAGVALDFHTISSTPIGYNAAGRLQFDTDRPEIAELLFRLKYRNDATVVPGIVAAAVQFLLPHRPKLDILVPVPPSNSRPLQPVAVLAQGIGAGINIPVGTCVTTTRPTTQLKGVTGPEERSHLVEGLYAIDPAITAGRNVLLFDDLFRSGTTMNAIADLIMTQGQARSIRALTITRTRSHR